MRAEPVLVAMETPVGNDAGEHRGAGALPAFGVGAGADHGIAVDHGGGFHPCAVVAFLRHIAGEVGRAGLEYLNAAAGDERLALLADLERLRRRPENLPVIRIKTAL